MRAGDKEVKTDESYTISQTALSKMQNRSAQRQGLRDLRKP